MRIKVITLNMWEGILLDEATRFLKAENPDVLLMQEVYGENNSVPADQFCTLEIVKESLGFTYSYYTPGFRHVRKEGKFLQGNAVLSKFPIKQSDAVFFNDPYNDNYIDNPPMFPHTLQSVVLGTKAGEVNVFNLHGTWDLDGDNYGEKRQQMSEAMIKAVDGKDKVILAGDTNAKPTNQAMRNVEKYLISVFGNDLTTTFNMRHKDYQGYATAAVDMMFVSQDIEVLSKDCPDVDVSDHLPLVATLEIA